MIDKYSIEFSKLYSRLMRLELHMKNRAADAILSYYKEEALKTFSKFFKNKNRLKRYQSKNGNTLTNILNDDKLDNIQKFLNLISSLYLSDLLCLILHCEEFFKPEITKKFYYRTPEKFAQLQKNRRHLTSLRNDIAHYNLKRYEKKKKNYWDVLLLFEIYMGHNTNGISSLPYFNGRKPSSKEILTSIAHLRSDLLDINPKQAHEMEYHYNKHRLILELFDEIALYNGYGITELPSPWTVFREMYRVKKVVISTPENGQKTLDLLPAY